MRRLALALALATSAPGCGGRSRLPLPAPPPTLVATAEDAFLEPPPSGDALRLPVLPEVEESALANGMRVFVVRAPDLPLVSVVFASRGGSAQDRGLPHGIDELLEWVLYRINEQQDVDIGPSGVLVTSSGTSDELGELIIGASEIVRHATLPEAIVEAERARLRGEIVDSSRSWAVRVRSVHERALIYGESDPRAQPWYGTLDAFGAISTEALLARHHQLFASDASAIVVVGDVDPADVRARVEGAFGSWSEPARPAERMPPAAFPRPGSRLHAFPTGGPATIALRERAPHRLHEDRPAFEVVTALLGGMFGLAHQPRAA